MSEQLFARNPSPYRVTTQYKQIVRACSSPIHTRRSRPNSVVTESVQKARFPAEGSSSIDFYIDRELSAKFSPDLCAKHEWSPNLPAKGYVLEKRNWHLSCRFRFPFPFPISHSHSDLLSAVCLSVSVPRTLFKEPITVLSCNASWHPWIPP